MENHVYIPSQEYQSNFNSAFLALERKIAYQDWAVRENLLTDSDIEILKEGDGR